MFENFTCRHLKIGGKICSGTTSWYLIIECWSAAWPVAWPAPGMSSCGLWPQSCFRVLFGVRDFTLYCEQTSVSLRAASVLSFKFTFLAQTTKWFWMMQPDFTLGAPC